VLGAFLSPNPEYQHPTIESRVSHQLLVLADESSAGHTQLQGSILSGITMGSRVRSFQMLPFLKLIHYIWTGSIQYKLVVHAFIDGKSHYVTGVQVHNNNWAIMVLQLFQRPPNIPVFHAESGVTMELKMSMLQSGGMTTRGKAHISGEGNITCFPYLQH
jgi:hypothetical protein